MRPACRRGRPPAPVIGEAPALVGAIRQAIRFERGLVSPSAGAIAAFPVVAVLGGGIGAGHPVAGVTMGAGAMLVGIAWRVRGGRPRRGMLAADALLMALSTLLGCLTGATPWLHLAVLAAWSLTGGLLVALGPGGAVLGNQAVLAAIVFGRFAEPAPAALALAGLVLAGGAAQVGFLTLMRLPAPLRIQRTATAAAFRALAELARGPTDASTLPAAAALDEAEAALWAPALFGDAALVTLRTLVSEGKRMRVALAAVRAFPAPGGRGALGAPGLAALAEDLERAAGADRGPT